MLQSLKFLGVKQAENVAATFSQSYICCSNIFGAALATLAQLVDALSEATGIEPATVFSFGRFAREAGLISQGGRGRGGAAMTLRDAANLCIAVMGSEVARDGHKAIHAFRSLYGTAWLLSTDTEDLFTEWLLPLKPKRKRGELLLPSDFGEFLEWLISDADRTDTMLRRIPTTEIPKAKWKEWKERFANATIDDGIAAGFLHRKEPEHVVIDEDVQLRLVFDRTNQQVELEIARLWDAPEDVLAIRFIAKSGFKHWGAYRQTITITQNVILALSRLFETERQGSQL